MDKYDILIEKHKGLLNQTLPMRSWTGKDGKTYELVVRSGKEYDEYMKYMDEYLIFISEHFPIANEELNNAEKIIQIPDDEWIQLTHEALSILPDTDVHVFVFADLIRKKVPHVTRSKGFAILSELLAKYRTV